MIGPGKFFDTTINPIKVLLIVVGILFITTGLAWHGLMDGGPYQPIAYLFNFPVIAFLLVAPGVGLLMLASKQRDNRNAP